MSQVLHRHTRTSPPMAVRGEGAYIIDMQGKRYLDACGGAAVSCLGHSHPAVIEAIKRQLDQLPYAHTGFFTSAPLERLADRLIGYSNGKLARASFYCGGSEAMEAAIKNARQYFVETGQASRQRFIARRQSFHGNTLALLSIGNHAGRAAPYQPYLFQVDHIAPAYAYRDRRIDETDEVYGKRIADELELAIISAGPETVAAFVAETVAGATLGAATAPAGYFRRIREICDRYGVLLILDEVMAGSGRTGVWFAFETEGVTPDIAVVAKGLGAGYQPISAVLLNRKIVEAIDAGSGVVAHSHTYMGHASGAAAALAVLDTVEAEGLLRNVAVAGARMREQLNQRFGEHPHIGDIRGRGLLLAMEIVADCATKKPFDPARPIGAEIKAAALEAGLMVYPSSGTIDGRNGAHVLLAPPYIITSAQIDEITDKLEAAFDAVFDARPQTLRAS
jgi:adenosylmethionine-8-amino-7-oxononanoate aminotransferase